MTILKETFLQSRRGHISSVSVRELYLFATNDGDLYRQGLQSININMGNKYKKGVFDLHESARSYKHFVDHAAKKYVVENCTESGTIFNSAERWACAYEIAEANLDEMELGNFTER